MLRAEVTDHCSRWQIGLALSDTVVSGAGIVKKQMQIGSAVVKMGGIAGVWTDDDHRMKGYASQAMWESIALMEQKHCDMSILFGIADFYHRYGYAVAFASQSMQVATAQLLKLNGSLRARTGRKADLAVMRQLYRRYNAGRSGMDARPSNWKPRWYMPRLGAEATRRAGKVLVVC
ncbi:MAG: GNAT family N-acetyltransferase, partial [Candidatus Latescibacteria bacterium]|nr:GNAT family N-acetyltransferase [Candidatus Latescibacterota bacterium]